MYRRETCSFNSSSDKLRPGPGSVFACAFTPFFFFLLLEEEAVFEEAAKEHKFLLLFVKMETSSREAATNLNYSKYNGEEID